MDDNGMNEEGNNDYRSWDDWLMDDRNLDINNSVVQFSQTYMPTNRDTSMQTWSTYNHPTKMLSSYIPVRVVKRNFVGQLQPRVKRMETLPNYGFNRNHHHHHTSMFISFDRSIDLYTPNPYHHLPSHRVSGIIRDDLSRWLLEAFHNVNILPEPCNNKGFIK